MTYFHLDQDLVTIYFKFIYNLSLDQGCSLIVLTCNDEHWLAVRQPYLEGMLPYEYSVLLKVLEKIGITSINIYLEALSVEGSSSLSNKTHPVKHYFNKRFYKFTEDNSSYAEIESQMSPLTEEMDTFKTLIGYEGIMLPSKTELNFAKRGKFDLYTLTNLSFMDLALHMNITPNLFAITRTNLANREEQIESFADFKLFSTFNNVKLSNSLFEK
jgi:hypothetical protein